MAVKRTKKEDTKRYKFDLAISADIHYFIPACKSDPLSTHFPTGQEITARIRRSFEHSETTDVSVEEVKYIIVIVSCYDNLDTDYPPVAYGVNPALVWPSEFPYEME